MKGKTIIQIVLLLVIIGLGVLIYMSINKPLKYDEAFNERKERVVNKLKDIRTFEGIYKSAYGTYTADFDSLASFILTGQVPMLKKTGDVPDTLTEEQALKMGLISRDTIYISVKESIENENLIFYSIHDFEKDIPNLKYVPYTDRKVVFDLEAKIKNIGNVNVPLFQASAKFEDFLVGLDEDYNRNKISQAKDLEKFPGWKVGSMDEPSTDGNWE